MSQRIAQRWPDFLLPAGIIACLMVIFVPLPPGLMDILLATNIAVAVVLLLTTVYVRSPLELSVFPSLLLMTTLARLALNVGTTRLILTRGATEGDLAAGHVIQSFSQFVTGDSLTVGLVIFAIIIVIQFVVITKGATRISEVAARFTLDGLPGRQMAIDADLNAGIIDNAEAQRRREDTLAHAEFYGTMDGASKFVRGDAIAGVVITVINILGGLAIGMGNSMSLTDAATTFTQLTIGDGLVSQVPALLISMAAGLLVTRSTRQTDLPRESMRQVFARPIVLVITALFLGLMVLTDLPKIPLLMIAMACLGGAYLLFQNQPAPAADDPEPAETPAQDNGIENLLSNDGIELQLGVGLLRLATMPGDNLLSRVTSVRKSVAHEMGIVLPKVFVRDNMNLEANQFRIMLHGRMIDHGRVQPDFCLAIDSGNATQPLADGLLKGIADEHLAEGPAFWISPEGIESATESGYEVETSVEVLLRQLHLAATDHADQLLTRDATRQLLDGIRKTSPTVVEELIPDLMSVSQVQQVLKGLVHEGISIRPLNLILETLGDQVEMFRAGQQFKRSDGTESGKQRGGVPWQLTTWHLIEQSRIRLANHIGAGLSQDDGQPVSVVTISEELEHRIACAWDREQGELRVNLPKVVTRSLAVAINDAAEQMVIAGLRPIAMVDQAIRPVMVEILRDNPTPIFVLGSREAESAEIHVVGEIKTENVQNVANAAA